MEGKYTLRDFLVYFLTGLFLLLSLLYQFNNSLLEFFNISKQDIKENPIITIFLLVPGLYLLGHIVHGIDFLIFKIGRIIWDLKTNNQKKLKRFRIYWLINILSKIINGTRVKGILDYKNMTSQVFWKKVSKLQYNLKFEKAEYWNLMKDLFLGLTLVSSGWTFYYLIHCLISLFLISLILSILFWYRARQMATNFVSTVNNTYEIETE